jgi:coenzyme F420-reducing hydrogenase beta subunit
VPNNLAMAEAREKGLKQVAFVGVPCQVTPVRKMQLKDPAFLDNGRKKESTSSGRRASSRASGTS